MTCLNNSFMHFSFPFNSLVISFKCASDKSKPTSFFKVVLFPYSHCKLLDLGCVTLKLPDFHTSI